MANERLRAALFERGVTVAALAEAVSVAPKTVERWITQERPPYPRHRHDAAAYLRVDEDYLWPDPRSGEQITGAAESEIVSFYPHRWSAPKDLSTGLVGEAKEEIAILSHGDPFIVEDSELPELLADKARAGVRVRFLLGDPESPQVARRGADGGGDDNAAARIRGVIRRYRSLIGMDGVEFRLHDTEPYNSICRSDDQFLVAMHVYGVVASNAPLMHLRKLLSGDMTSTYETSFERVWEGARPLSGE